ncbi:hypothetical protein PIB30_101143 [Stylosanthes scabra]|uniref:Uncharacterized protein n=1 Tax=Stylosanthes scabra TaxID=79078 RepID=A0ABU6QY23_9FABA|nr:hypothetical protein [Stylosanthes scabra]
MAGERTRKLTFGASKSRLEVTNVTRSGAQPKLNVTWFEVCGVTFGKLRNVTRFGTPKRDKGVGARRAKRDEEWGTKRDGHLGLGGLNVVRFWVPNVMKF